MDYLSSTDMVRWQGRRLAAESRAKSRIARLVILFKALAVGSLIVGFYSGLPVPIDLLQTLTLLAVVGLLVFVARAGVDRVVNRDAHSFHRRR